MPYILYKDNLSTAYLLRLLISLGIYKPLHYTLASLNNDIKILQEASTNKPRIYFQY